MIPKGNSRMLFEDLEWSLIVMVRLVLLKQIPDLESTETY
jgi:hypothetical protein